MVIGRVVIVLFPQEGLIGPAAIAVIAVIAVMVTGEASTHGHRRLRG